MAADREGCTLKTPPLSSGSRYRAAFVKQALAGSRAHPLNTLERIVRGLAFGCEPESSFSSVLGTFAHKSELGTLYTKSHAACAMNREAVEFVAKDLVYKRFSPQSAWDKELQAYLESGLGKEAFQHISEALCRPPLSTCIRANTLRTTRKVSLLYISGALGLPRSVIA